MTAAKFRRERDITEKNPSKDRHPPDTHLQIERPALAIYPNSNALHSFDFLDLHIATLHASFASF